MGGNGVLWGEVGANNKKCVASVDWLGFPILPHFPPGSLGALANAPPPSPIALLPIKTIFLTFSTPKIPIFLSSIHGFPPKKLRIGVSHRANALLQQHVETMYTNHGVSFYNDELCRVLREIDVMSDTASDAGSTG